MDKTKIITAIRNSCETNGNESIKKYMGTSNPEYSNPQYANDNGLPNIVNGIVNGIGNLGARVTGVGAGGTIDLGKSPAGVAFILAFVTASGVPANPCLLIPGTDYSLSENILTCITNQSVNTLCIVFL